MIKTLEQLDSMIQALKKAQYKSDRACRPDEEGICPHCRYWAGYWGDIKIKVELVEDE